MTDYSRTNSGALFKNNKKQKDAHPDYQGNINVGGVEYRLAAWLKTSKKGDRYMSLAVSLDEKQEVPARKTEVPASQQPFQDEVPF